MRERSVKVSLFWAHPDLHPVLRKPITWEQPQPRCLYDRFIVDGVAQVPREIDGQIVTSIEPFGFANCKTVRTIVIPEKVIRIGDCAFINSSVEHVVIPAALTYIGSSAFRNTKIIDIDLSHTSVTYLGPRAFYMATRLRIFTLPPHITSLSDQVFAYSGLRFIRISRELKSVSSDCFKMCCRLQHFQSSSPDVVVVSGALYTRDRKCLLRYPAFTEPPLLPTVVVVSPFAFSGTRISSVRLPESVKVLGDGAFLGCHRLVDFDASVARLWVIPGRVFADCKSLRVIRARARVLWFARSAFAGAERAAISITRDPAPLLPPCPEQSVCMRSTLWSCLGPLAAATCSSRLT